ncbi:right-handed parallel beta-helix repeat-containing protein [Curtobacterium sp. RRHDQ66]|uniref:right-handed parallel beta-helix repeat-containing protein n=1 Tax=Curtobacterium guangdongense TaxID=3413380 RepID=UPI003BF09D2F
MSSRGATRRTAILWTGAVATCGAVALIAFTGCPEADGESADDPLQAALDAIPVGGTLMVDRAWTRSVSLAVRHGVTVAFTGAGAIRMSRDVDAIVVTASGVNVVNPVISGIGATATGRGHGIAVMGTAGEPLHDVRISGGRLRDLRHDGVHVEYCDAFVLERTTISSVGYAGVSLVGVVDALVQDTVVSDVRQPAGWPNSYGITVTRNATTAVATTRRSSRIRILRNRVSGVPKWEGIDTHAGSDVEIRDNVVSGCRVGIAAVPSKAAADPTTTDVAPTGLVVAGNVVTRTDALGVGSGILVSGAGSTVGSDAPRATGSVTGNTVTGGGGTSAAGILVKLTSGFVIADNTVLSSAVDGICLQHSNTGITVRGNRIRGVSGPSVAIDVRAGANDGVIQDNRVEPSPKVRVGLRLGSPDNRFVVRGNAFAAATVPEALGGATITR